VAKSKFFLNVVFDSVLLLERLEERIGKARMEGCAHILGKAYFIFKQIQVLIWDADEVFIHKSQPVPRWPGHVYNSMATVRHAILRSGLDEGRN
jgi:hypothetical protein